MVAVICAECQQLARAERASTHASVQTSQKGIRSFSRLGINPSEPSLNEPFEDAYSFLPGLILA